MTYEFTDSPAASMDASNGGAIVLTPRADRLTVPAIIADLGDHAARRFLEFFTVNIRNSNTRTAYAQAVAQFFRWCESRRLGFRDIEPMAVAAYIESHTGSDPTSSSTWPPSRCFSTGW